MTTSRLLTRRSLSFQGERRNELGQFVPGNPLMKNISLSSLLSLHSQNDSKSAHVGMRLYAYICANEKAN